jgi:hypothetical protein
MGKRCRSAKIEMAMVSIRPSAMLSASTIVRAGDELTFIDDGLVASLKARKVDGPNLSYRSLEESC